MNNNSSDDEEFFLKPKKKSNKNLKKTKTLNVNVGTYLERAINPIVISNSFKKEKEIKEDKKEKEIEEKEDKNKPKNRNDASKDFINSHKINFFLKIDHKNCFHEMTDEEYSSIKEVISSFNDKKNIEINSINKIMKIFLDKICPNCKADATLISKYLSKEIRKLRKKNKTKIEIEQYINYFFSLRYDLLYSTNYYLNKKSFRYLGYILSYIFSKLSKYYTDINDSEELHRLINDNIKKRIDVLTDYYTYVNENNIKEDDIRHKKTDYWKKNRNRYSIVPELNFLINRFIKITTIEIDLDLQREIIDDTDFKLISIVLLNLNIIFVNIEHFKISFINQKFLYKIYTGYFRDLLNSTSINKNIIKKNRIKYPELLYDKKWNFLYNFNLEEYRIIDKNKNKEEFNIKNLQYDNYNTLYINKNKKDLNKKQILNSSIKKVEDINKIKTDFKKTDNNGTTNIFNNSIIIEKNNLQINKKTNNKIYEIIRGKDYYINIIKENSSILDLLAIIICSIGILKKINNLDIIMSDSYNNEFITHLVNSYDINEEIINDDFHLLDFIYNKIKDLKNFNIEINGLDIITFNKVLNLININDKLNSLKLSLFSSDVIYFRRSLLKLYNQIIGGAEDLIKNDSKNIESKIFKDLLPFFIENLAILFEILKKEQNLETLGFNFDLPPILANNHIYIIPILKFIINILLLIDKNKCQLKNLTLLSPSIVIDNKIYSGIIDIFSKININKNNKILKELNIQLQFYHMVHIKNLISNRLIKLNIGDLDLVTFKVLVNYLISYKFSSKSNLECLGIGLNKTLTQLNTELKMLFRELFTIKIANLSKLNLYTNIIIKDEKNYNYLIEILRNNWIPSYTITFNSKCNDILDKCKNLKNNILYLVPYELDIKLLGKEEENPINNGMIYWYLKYLFNYIYCNNDSNFISKKRCIFTILKYLYNEKIINISHNLEDEIKNK